MLWVLWANVFLVPSPKDTSFLLTGLLMGVSQRSSILSYRYRKYDTFREKYRIGIVSVSKIHELESIVSVSVSNFQNGKYQYQYRYHLLLLFGLKISIIPKYTHFWTKNAINMAIYIAFDQRNGYF